MTTTESIAAPVNVSDDALRGRRVVVMGLGRFGGGVGVTRFLARCGADVLVTDHADAEQLRSAVDAVGDARVTYRFGPHDPSDLEGASLLVVSPAVDPRRDPFVGAAIGRGVAWTTEINLLLARCPATLIGVTGSVGKSTTCTMIHAMLERAIAEGAVAYRAAHLGGNIGTSLLDGVDRMDRRDVAVLELSSFQLEWVIHGQLRLRIAVITNVAAHHLDRHRTMPAYLDAKLNLLRGQPPADAIILGSGDEPLRSAVRQIGADRGIPIRAVTSDTAERVVNLPGEHNRQNASVAVAAAVAAGAPESVCRAVLGRLTALPHRLEWIGAKNGVGYYNDSKSTSAGSLAVAIAAFDEPIVLLCGGKVVTGEIAAIAKLRFDRVVCAACFGEARRVLIEVLGAQLGRRRVCAVETVQDAVRWAFRTAEPGQIVLFSPGLPSYDAFCNYEQRGEAFRNAVGDHHIR